MAGARTVAAVFKVAAVVVLLGGSAAGVIAARSVSSWVTNRPAEIAIVAGIVAVAILLASALGFFAYVLELLMALHEKS
ncbi:MAG: hypothetical protein JWM85_2105 [Acidimicrobiaceae bacterium]|nr:hypothetical protein [Acidimicrobiaceae bacterium]